MKAVTWNSIDKGEDRVAMERFLDDVGLGALFITVGTLWFAPAGQLPRGTWMIAVGGILLVLNAARYILRIRVNGFTMVAGILTLLAGVGAACAVDLPIFPIALVAIGVCLLLGSAIKNFRRSTDQEHGACC